MARCLLLPAASLLLALTQGCGQATEPCPEVEGAFACVEGATLALAPGTWCEFPPASAEGLEAEARKALAIAAETWQVRPGEYLTGWVISFCDGWFACGAGSSATWTYGCAQLDEEHIMVGPTPAGCASGVLVHELGHLVVRGDRDHRDPRFLAATALAAAVCE